MTPDYIVKLMVESGKKADELKPGLRQQNADAWMQLAAGLGNSKDSHIGRKARSVGARISPDTMAYKSGSEFYAVSIIRDDPDNGNPWRSNPEDHGLVSGQHFVPVSPVPWDDSSEVPDDLELRVKRIEDWIRKF